MHPRAVARGADARRHAAGNEAGEIERDVLVDHDDRGLIDHGAFGKGADHAEGADGDAVAVAPAVGAVELRPLGDARTFGAEMMQALAAPAAISAAGDEGEHHVVAGLDAADRGADVFDHAGGLVAEHHRPHRHAPLAAHHVIVGAAQAYRGDAHQDLGGPRRIERDALDRQRRADVAKKGGHGLHE